MAERIQTFQEFWPYYLREHRLPRTRRIHFWGTSFAVTVVLAAAVLQNFWLFLASLIAGYGPAWYAHFFVEKNRPATFKYPFWSLAADFRLWFLILTRQRID